MEARDDDGERTIVAEPRRPCSLASISILLFVLLLVLFDFLK